ncbi:MAG TPA: aldehyde ferredoxin oxidoreductase C-terminal domain-containing protein, partial [Oligoflexia bacterium]|nr:aldehyde ferredoxin oxidoreductase C-terminal domain-containing protein [Oligoflexia bacterium]
NGDALAWGDTHGMVEMMRKITFREGVGDILAEGTGQAAAKLGHAVNSLERRSGSRGKTRCRR